jgi:glycosyltransferase involved in cell wall biosynthesis
MSDRRFSVAMVAPAFPLSLGTVDGGTAGVAWYLCQALRDTGELDLEVIRPFAPKGTPALFTLGGIRVHALSRPSWQPRPLHLLWTAQRQVRRLVRSLKPDLAHVQAMTGLAACLAQPCVFTLHGISEIDAQFRGARWSAVIRQAILGCLEKRARQRVRNVIAISPYTRRFISTANGQRVWDIANPVPDAYFMVQRQPQPGRVFSASQISPLKNVAALIRAFAELSRKLPAARLRLAGAQSDGPYGQECRRLAGELGVGDQVAFLGLLNMDQVRNELAHAAVFALCSLQENAPLSIAESMAAGVPVMATRVGGVPWMVEDGVTGRLLDPGDQGQMSGTLGRMLLTDNLAAMSQAAKSKAEQTYRSALIAKKTIKMYHELLQ